ncbi:phosphate ABC transporter substrate-binding protein, PhoT family [Sulfurivirga caldicuralii]|uniref:Phosphate-binding protein PstS n=1 Tax=Sulfurivirga caldicuralii TaxID=364032 RepID=A0A1N6GDX0_9GAMM|nr:phosphate ABC transporter substrate-binding protein PstS [Sulfurivirga caldicuralii]SIO05676.1 phosphate ABC transporter substrate-binding protein, PhoT family [Sulfurivirga caldicuralii]
MLKKVMLAGTFAVAATTAYAGTTVQGTGSSFAYPLYKSWATEYYNATGNKVNYTATGSGTGIKAVSAREVDFGGSDKPLAPKTLKKKGLYQFPTAMGAIVMAYNVPGVDHLRLSEKAHEGIVLGSVKYWDNPLLKKENPNANLPHKPILFVHRSDKSGTTFAYTYYLSKMSKTWRKRFGAKKMVNWPMENRIGGKGNFGVTTAIKTNKYSIGYADYADAVHNGLKMAEIEAPSGEYIKPSLASFQEAAKYADLDPKKDFYANIAYPPKGYPIVTATFVLMPQEKPERSKEVVKFFDFGFKNGDDNATELGYVPLPADVKEKIRGYWKEKGLY